MNKDNEQREISRPLKFRVWNGAEMVYHVTVGRFGVFYVNPTNNGLDPNDSASITPFTTKYHEGTPVMQFTGLLDKNKKEIYEGDRVAEIDKLEELESWGDPLTVEFGQYITDTDKWGLRSPTTGFFLRYKDGSITGIHSQDEGYGFNAKNLLIVSHIYSSEPIVK